MALWREVMVNGRAWLSVTAIASLLGAGVALALPMVLGAAIDAIVTGADVTALVLIAAGLVGLSVLMDLGGAYVTASGVAGTTAWLRLRLVRHLLALSPANLGRFANGDLVTRVSGNAAEAAQAGPSTVGAVAASIPPLGSLVLLVLIDLWAAAALLAGLAVSALVLRAFARHTTHAAAGYQVAQGAIAARLSEAMTGIRTIAASGTAAFEAKRILEPLPELAAQGKRMWHVLARTSAQASLAGPVVVVSVLAVAGWGVASGRVSPGELFAASRYAAVGAGLGGLTGVLGVLSRARSALARVQEPLRQPVLAYGSRDVGPGSGQLEFRHVTVESLLHTVNLTVQGGSFVAVTGRSGAGKSIFAELVARLRDPCSGDILLDGIPLRDLSEHSLRRAIGCAFDRPQLVGRTVGDSISNDVAGADAMQVHAFLSRLPQGYDTPLAETPLSGGERQRLGLARMWGANRVLVFDDAMSSLDTVNHMRVAQRLEDDPRTRIVVTNKASLAARADLVVWLDDGKVRAAAPHAVLWHDPGYRAVLQ